MSIAFAKAEARKLAFAARKLAHSASAGHGANRILQDWMRAHVGKPLAGYMPMRTEIDPLPCMAAHAGTVAVPVVIGAGQALKFRQWTADTAMIPGSFGALIPAAGAWIEPEIVIVPLLAFDRRGYRLGYGGGFYDRTLERQRACRPTLAVGFAYAAQEIAEVPIERTDQPLDLIITEAGILQP
jgi:5-formyltetrahydrofolate cyclo-ligase